MCEHTANVNTLDKTDVPGGGVGLGGGGQGPKPCVSVL